MTHDALMIAGDWNADIQRPCSFTDIVQSFLSELNLSFADLRYADDVRFTYMSHNGSKSWLDHVAVSNCILLLISNVHTISDGRNLSDHNPLVFCLDPPCTAGDYRFFTATETITTRAWYKANNHHISMFQNIVGHALESMNIELNDDIISCCNPTFTTHQQQL